MQQWEEASRASTSVDTLLRDFPLLILPGIATAQGGVQDGVKVGKVYVTGENPGIRLLDNPAVELLTAVSSGELRGALRELGMFVL